MTPNQLGAELYLDPRRPDIDSIRKAANEAGGSYTGVQKFVRRKQLEEDNPGFAKAAADDNMDSLRVKAMWKTPKGRSRAQPTARNTGIVVDYQPRRPRLAYGRSRPTSGGGPLLGFP